MVEKNNPEVWAGLLIFLLSLLFFMEAFKYPYESAIGGFGPGYMTRWFSGILAICSLVYVYQSLKKKEAKTDFSLNRNALKKILFTIFALFLFVVLLSYIGYTVAAAILIFMLLHKAYPWYVNVGISIGIAILMFVVFNYLLGIQLPVNGLGW